MIERPIRETPPPSSVSADVAFERFGPVAQVTLMRGHKLNAVTTPMSERLLTLFSEIDADPAIRVAILAAVGRCFCAGADIHEYAGHRYTDFVAYQRGNRRLNDLIEGNRKPVIAAVQGPALGGGFELALACDLIIACRDAYFALPEVSLGLVPGGGATYRLTRLIGRNRAKDLAMTGRRWSADEAFAAGVVSAVVQTADDAVASARQVADELAGKPPLAIQQVKRLVNDGQDPGLSSALSYEQAVLAGLFVTDDGQEGIQAFVAKREPRFSATATDHEPGNSR